MILDDAVVHDRDAVARYMRVRVVHGRDAVGSPSGMRYTHVAADRGRVERILQNLHLADGAQAGDPTALEHGDAGRIIPSIFEAAQAIQN